MGYDERVEQVEEKKEEEDEKKAMPTESLRSRRPPAMSFRYTLSDI